MKREDFIFTVGFDGSTAIVDGGARRKHQGKSIDEMLEAGLLKQAVFAAAYDGDVEALGRIMNSYNQASGSALEEPEDLFKIYGVPLQVLETDQREGLAVKVEVI
jgi:hypothetical protein